MWVYYSYYLLIFYKLIKNEINFNVVGFGLEYYFCCSLGCLFLVMGEYGD